MIYVAHCKDLDEGIRHSAFQIQIKKTRTLAPQRYAPCRGGDIYVYANVPVDAYMRKIQFTPFPHICWATPKC